MLLRLGVCFLLTLLLGCTQASGGLDGSTGPDLGAASDDLGVHAADLGAASDDLGALVEDLGVAADAGSEVDGGEGPDGGDAAELRDATEPADAEVQDAGLCAPSGALRWPADSVQGTLPFVTDRPGCRGDSSNHAAVWRLEVPTESTVVLRAEVLVPGAHAFLRVRPACGEASTDLLCAPSGGSELPMLLQLTLPAGSWDVVLETWSRGRADYRLSLGPLSPIAEGLCRTARPLRPPETVTVDLGRGLSAYDDVCRDRTSPHAYYQVEIPPHSALEVWARPTPADWNPVLQVLASCGAMPPCGQDAADYGQAERIFEVNATDHTRSATVVLSPEVPSESGSAELSVAIVPLPSQEALSCAAPHRLVPPGRRIVDPSLFSASQVPCGPSLPRLPETFLEAAVSGGRTFVVQARALQPTPGEISFRRYDSCSPLSCAGGSAGSLRIESATSTTALLSVGLHPVFPIPYELQYWDFVPPRSRTPISAACDDLSGAPTLVELVMTPPGSPFPYYWNLVGGPQALPAPITFLGHRVTHLSALPSFELVLSEGPRDRLTTRDLSLVLFEDAPTTLAVRPGSTVRGMTLGAAGSRRMVVEWFEVENGTVQAKIFEDGAVEFHYCRAPYDDFDTQHLGLRGRDYDPEVMFELPSLDLRDGMGWRFSPE